MTDMPENMNCHKGFEEAVRIFHETLPGWWYSVGFCSLTCHASCGPDGEWQDKDLVRSARDPFDNGFHADLPQPSTLAAALIDAMKQAVSARNERLGLTEANG